MGVEAAAEEEEDRRKEGRLLGQLQALRLAHVPVPNHQVRTTCPPDDYCVLELTRVAQRGSCRHNRLACGNRHRSRQHR